MWNSARVGRGLSLRQQPASYSTAPGGALIDKTESGSARGVVAPVPGYDPPGTPTLGFIKRVPWNWRRRCSACSSAKARAARRRGSFDAAGQTASPWPGGARPGTPPPRRSPPPRAARPPRRATPAAWRRTEPRRLARGCAPGAAAGAARLWVEAPFCFVLWGCCLAGPRALAWMLFAGGGRANGQGVAGSWG